MMDTDQKTQVKSAQDNLKNLSEMEEASEKGEQFLTKHFSKNLKLSRVFIKFKYSEKAKNFCKISMVDLSYLLMYLVTIKSKMEISPNFVASQSIWTLQEL